MTILSHPLNPLFLAWVIQMIIPHTITTTKKLISSHIPTKTAVRLVKMILKIPTTIYKV